MTEEFIRESLLKGAVLFALITAGITVTSGNLAWAVTGIFASLLAIVLVLVVAIRGWSFGTQWTVIAGVLLLQIIIIAIFGQAYNNH